MYRNSLSLLLSGNYKSVITDDVDLDGKTEVLLNDGTSLILYHPDTGTTTTFYSGTSLGKGMTASDVDNDGEKEVVAIDNGRVLYIETNGTVSNSIVVSYSDPDSVSVAGGQFSGDTSEDVLVVTDKVIYRIINNTLIVESRDSVVPSYSMPAVVDYATDTSGIKPELFYYRYGEVYMSDAGVGREASVPAGMVTGSFSYCGLGADASIYVNTISGIVRIYTGSSGVTAFSVVR